MPRLQGDGASGKYPEDWQTSRHRSGRAIFEFVQQLFDTTGFPKRWNCGQWTSAHGWTHIVSDILIGAAYLAIPAVLAWFMVRRKEVPFGLLFWAFALFILSCGIGHLIEASIFWHPWYRLSGATKVVTAAVSWATVFGLIAVLPKALAMPRLASLSERLISEVAERTRIEQKYRDLYETSPAYYVTTDLETGQISLCNRSFADGIGLKRDQLIGRRLEDLCAPDSVEAVRECLAALRSGQDVDNRVLSLRRATDGPLTVLFSGNRLPYLETDRTSAACALRDITEQKHVELALRDSEQRFQSVIEHTPSAILLVDADGQIVLSNQKAVDFFGFSRDELLGQKVELLIPERHGHVHIAYREKFFLAPQARSMGSRDLKGRRKDGSEFPIEVGLNPIWMNGKRHVVAAVQDITERQLFIDRLEKTASDLRRMNQDLEEIAYAASHDLQEPLRAVSGYCQLLKIDHREHLNQEASDYLDKAIAGTQRMHALIHGLLAFSRVQRLGNAFDRVDCSSAMKYVLENLEMLIAESEAEIHVGPLPAVCGDQSQIVQLLQNLIVNAVKFRGAAAPVVRVSAERIGNEWRFAVEDNGIGIAPEFREKIFLIFQRLHSRDDYDGTGLGLAICKQIVERHRGTIWVEGEGGRGSIFLFTLPDASQLTKWRAADGGAGDPRSIERQSG